MSQPKQTIHKFDVSALAAIRQNVSDLVRRAGEQYDRKTLKVLEIGPTAALDTAACFPLATIETLDIARDSGATYVADICKDNRNFLYSKSFGLVICTEVLEHVKNPFAAVAEIHRVLKPGGILVASSPFNFRIHGPLPDCWRFTEHGWRELLDGFDIRELNALESERFLAPIHYTIIAQKYD